MDGNTLGGIIGSIGGVLGGLVGTYFSIKNTNGPKELRQDGPIGHDLGRDLADFVSM